MVSVEPVELSVAFFRHPRGAARTSATAAAAASDARILLCIVPPSGNDQRATRAPKAARSAVLARVLKARSAEVVDVRRNRPFHAPGIRPAPHRFGAAVHGSRHLEAARLSRFGSPADAAALV